MGFLIFAFRKLSLKRTINQKNFRLMQLCSRQQQLQETSGLLQQAKSLMQDAWNMTSGNIGNIATCLNQSNMDKINSRLDVASNKYDKVYDDFKNGKASAAQLDAARMEYEKAQKEAEESTKDSLKLTQAGIGANLVAGQVVNSVFAASEKAQMAVLNSQSQSIDMEKTALESQLKLLNEELASVDKAESDAAKKAAPTFGLS